MDQVGFYLAYLYLMRVPIFAWIILVAFPIASVPTGAPLGSLLRGIFDLSSQSPYLTGLSLGMVAFFGLLTGVAIGVPARLILLDGEARFGASLAVLGKPILRRILIGKASSLAVSEWCLESRRSSL